MPTSPLRLEDQLCFALYAATNAITRAYREKLGDIGLTYPQYLVVMALLGKPSMTSGELARSLRLDAGTLTPMLKRLDAAGLIERTRRTEDERIIDNQLTVRGLALQQEMQDAQSFVVCRAELSEHDLQALRTALHQLTDSLCGAPVKETEPV